MTHLMTIDTCLSCVAHLSHTFSVTLSHQKSILVKKYYMVALSIKELTKCDTL
jgi:hypothetical protein